MDKCGCVILNYNDSQTTIRLLKMIYSYNNIDEIIIVDNCSTDDSYVLLSKYSGKKISVLRTKKNGGYGYGNNVGINYAKNVKKCKYVLLSNPDVIFDEELVSIMIDKLCELDGGCISAIQNDIFNNPIKDIAWKIPKPFEYSVTNTRLSKFFNYNYKKSYFTNKDVVQVDCLPGAMLMFDTEKFEKSGGYDENMFLYCEEVAIACRLKEKGYKSYLLLNYNYRHEHSVSIDKTIASKRRQLELIQNNRIYVMQKYLDASKFVIYLTKKIHNKIIRKFD